MKMLVLVSYFFRGTGKMTEKLGLAGFLPLFPLFIISIWCHTLTQFYSICLCCPRLLECTCKEVVGFWLVYFSLVVFSSHKKLHVSLLRAYFIIDFLQFFCVRAFSRSLVDIVKVFAQSKRDLFSSSVQERITVFASRWATQLSLSLTFLYGVLSSLFSFRLSTRYRFMLRPVK